MNNFQPLGPVGLMLIDTHLTGAKLTRNARLLVGTRASRNYADVGSLQRIAVGPSFDGRYPPFHPRELRF